MTYYNVYIIPADGISYFKTDLRFKLAAPGIFGDSYILFKNIYGSTGTNKEEIGNDQGESQDMLAAGPFQWKIFLQI